MRIRIQIQAYITVSLVTEEDCQRMQLLNQNLVFRTFIFRNVDT